jgi:hypothetical protein
MTTALSNTDKFVASYAPALNGCLEWRKAKNKHGYGVMRCADGISRLAHRVAWQIYFGAPHNKHVLHSCDNPSCVNVGHLFLGDQSDNMADKMQKGRHKWGSKKWRSHELRPWAKLTKEQVFAIRADTRTQKIIAEEFGIVQQTVSDIKRRRRWAHVGAV